MNLELFPNQESEGEMIAQVDIEQMARDVDTLRFEGGMPGNIAIEQVLKDVSFKTREEREEVESKLLDALTANLVGRAKAGKKGRELHGMKEEDASDFHERQLPRGDRN